ncbi:MAG: methylmalonyl-CoA epimerase [Chitinophagaceae bacterium]
MWKLEHIGLAVNDLKSAIPQFEQLLQTPCYKTESLANEGVNTAFFNMANTKIELLEALSPENHLGKFLKKNGPGMHHMAFEVEDILSEMKRLENAGFVLLQPYPSQGADDKLVCFLHPKSTNGVLIELCQAKIPG